jgi:hypothetical protein
METTPEHLGYVQRRVAEGEYRISSQRVAQAMLEKIGAAVIGREIRPTHGQSQSLAANDHRAT